MHPRRDAFFMYCSEIFVFTQTPPPEIANRNVRQDWLNWNPDGICPMIYHGFYREDVSWTGDALRNV